MQAKKDQSQKKKQKMLIGLSRKQTVTKPTIKMKK